MSEEKVDQILRQLERQNHLLELLCLKGSGNATRDDMPLPEQKFKRN